MIILRQKEFGSTKKSREESDKAKAVTGKDIAVGSGIGAVAGATGRVINNQFGKKFINGESIDPREEKKLREELIKKAKKQGTRTIKTNAPNSFATESSAGKVLRGWLSKVAKKDKGRYRQLKKNMDAIMPGMSGNIGRDAIVLGDGRLAEADVLSHELGHTQYLHKGRSKNIIANTAHKLVTPSKFGTTSAIAPAAYGAHGYARGLKAAKMESEGKKEGIVHRVSSAALPALIASPMLIAEAAASKKGLKLLKQSGASKEALKIARKSLGNAYGTYASLAAGNVVAGEGGRLVGKAVGKRRYKKEKDEKEKR